MAAVLKLLERQLGLSEIKRRLEDVGGRAGRYLEDHVAYGPCLLVSRQRGSGGGRIAHLAAQRLGWPVFDREIVDEIARLAQARQQLMKTLEPRTRAKWEGAWEPELQPEDIGLEPYLRGLRQVVLGLGHQGDVVLLGRGAHYLLPAQCAVRVRIVAPLELRVGRIRECLKCSWAEGEAHVKSFDSSRTDFVNRAFRCDPNGALNYDLIINTGQLTVETALELVLVAMRRKLGVEPLKR